MPNSVRCFIFGSAVYSEKPDDLDVAIIYDKTMISINDAIQYRHNLEDELNKMLEMNIDTLLLSKEEEEEMCFLANAKHIPL